MRTTIRRAVIAAAMAWPSALLAQDVTVESVVDTRFYGAIGKMVDIAARFGGAKVHDVPTTTMVSRHKMRTENANSATVIDVDDGQWMEVDHKRKSYTTMTFAEMAAAMDEATRSAKSSRDKSAADNAKNPDAAKGDVNVKYSVAVDRTGERQRIAGYDAERLFITITVEAEATPEGEKTQQAGSLVMLLDQWMAKSAPQIAASEEFYKAFSAKSGQAFRTNAQSMQAAFQADPRLKTGMEAAAKELKKVSGVSLRSATYAVLLPIGMKFDRKLVLNDVAVATPAATDEKPKKGLRGMMGAMKAAAEDAAKGSDNKEPEPMKQTTLLAVTDEVKSISTGAVAASMFAPPAGYKLEARRR
ncbi:hypothetical protein [Gemmatimonas sp.]|uniref:hypothetical protein n=1 Tax=Gemmatimonas sp. TaxID=1962908 RepID=UPI003569A2EA